MSYKWFYEYKIFSDFMLKMILIILLTWGLDSLNKY